MLQKSLLACISAISWRRVCVCVWPELLTEPLLCRWGPHPHPTHTHTNGTALRPRGMLWAVGGGGVPTSHRDPSGTSNHQYPSETADALPTGSRNRSITKHIAHRTRPKRRPNDARNRRPRSPIAPRTRPERRPNDAQTTPETGVLHQPSRPEHVPNDDQTTPKRRPKSAAYTGNHETKTQENT